MSIAILKFLCTISGTFVYQIWYISAYYKKMLRFRRSIFSFLEKEGRLREDCTIGGDQRGDGPGRGERGRVAVKTVRFEARS